MNKSQIIKKTAKFARNYFKGDSSGHDWWHTFRVWNLAKKIAKKEKGADLFIIELAALLHDVDDWKLRIVNNKTEKWLDKLKIQKETKKHILEITKDLSFKGAGVKSKIKTLEGKIVQDTDRLDAIGALGISRAFAFGGSRNREIYNPAIKPIMHKTFESYKNNNNSSVNHFYEKLLLLKDLMNTNAARKIANQRHKYMENFLKQFFNEWNNKK
ncbi:MAG: phosphohydrolase [Candidatus Moranbacteria bacterium CG10_big_fil_rev_8_21_14_0_10_35_21]|nr:MAG: phosphohydrolase [Candidatus Moranbacteria bacterium CG10_big_fil_rev_8_21_14_0_10_35_21]PJA88975.1 MAG: phosphohydrolase [Candidatus Moranbacteria bacterium CG_4_9_14_3_um_filter_36_9]